jgi:hypothetical protein
MKNETYDLTFTLEMAGDTPHILVNADGKEHSYSSRGDTVEEAIAYIVGEINSERQWDADNRQGYRKP